MIFNNEKIEEILKSRFKPYQECDLTKYWYCEDDKNIRLTSFPYPENFSYESSKLAKILFNTLPFKLYDELMWYLEIYLTTLEKVFPYLDAIIFERLYFEWLYYTLTDRDKKYREHFIHSIKVGVIGRWLIEEAGLLDNIILNLKNNSRVKKFLADYNLESSEIKKETVLSVLVIRSFLILALLLKRNVCHRITNHVRHFGILTHITLLG